MTKKQVEGGLLCFLAALMSSFAGGMGFVHFTNRPNDPNAWWLLPLLGCTLFCVFVTAKVLTSIETTE